MTEPLDPQAPIARLRPGGSRRLRPSRRLRRLLTPARSADAGSPRGDGPNEPDLREWHTLTPAERETAWADLVSWAEWLHGRYELGVEEKLPHCWPQHPGLIEELWALRAWRLSIYTATGGAAGGQAARYWHGELRQLVTAALTVYAGGCRSGHKTAPPLTPGLSGTWLAADPLVGVPERLLDAARQNVALDDGGRYLSDRDMRAALTMGAARPLSDTMPNWVRHQDRWWTRLTGGDWGEAVEPTLISELDRAAVQMADADAAVQRQRMLRDALQPESGEDR